MSTNLSIDTEFLRKAQEAGGFRTKRETVTVALQELIERRGQRSILRSIGTFDFRPDWNHKKDRRKCRG